MTQSNNDIEELEELLTELEGQEAQLVRPYSEDDDAVTQLMDAPLGDQEWMVQVTALDRRMMSTDQVLSELRAGKLGNRTLVWRGGMEDWLPIARVDSLAQGSLAAGSLPPPSAPARSAAPAPLPGSPMWSTLPSAAPLPPPPSALAPSAPAVLPSSPSGGSPLGGLPPPAAAPAPSSQTGLSRPAAAAQPSPSGSSPVSSGPASSQGNTARPVALDFSDMVEDHQSPLRGKRALMALSAVAILAAFLSVYALSSKSDGTASAEASTVEQPRAVNALQPAASEKQAEPAPAPAEPAMPSAATSKPSESELAANEPSASNGSSARTNAPARYSPRSEYRRRPRGSAAAERAEEPSTEAPAAEVPAATPPRDTAAAAEEEAPSSESAPVAAADDDADAVEAPKSTGRANTFNRQAAKAALDEAAAQAKNCRPAGGPSGTGRVQVSYEPSGKVSGVTILTSKFENTTTGSCVRMLFRRAKVPEFTGVPVMVVSKAFEIP